MALDAFRSSSDRLRDPTGREIKVGDYVTLAGRNEAVTDRHLTTALGHVRDLDTRRNRAMVRLIWTDRQTGRRSGKDLEMPLSQLAQYRRVNDLGDPKGLADALSQIRERMKTATASNGTDMIELQRRIAKQNGFPTD
jgi:hypothetical protein